MSLNLASYCVTHKTFKGHGFKTDCHWETVPAPSCTAGPDCDSCRKGMERMGIKILDLPEKRPDPEYDADKGVPYRQLRKRTLYLLPDLSDADCRTVLLMLLDDVPQHVSASVAEFWEENVEAKRSGS